MVDSRSEYDRDRDGTVTAMTEATGVAQMTYTNTGTHSAVASIQDYAQGVTYYVDDHNFGY